MWRRVTNWMFRRHFVALRSLPKKADVIYVPSYGMKFSFVEWVRSILGLLPRVRENFRLSTMNEQCFTEALRYVQAGFAPRIVCANAYERWWKIELELRRELAMSMGLESDVVIGLGPVTNSYEENTLVAPALASARVIVEVADQYHAKRSSENLRTMISSDTILYVVSTVPRNYESLLEPNPIKVIRCGWGFLWAGWNILCICRDNIICRFRRMRERKVQ